MAMTCEEVREQIDREGAITTGEANAHVHECPSCQEFWANWQAIQREFQAMGAEATPPFLHTRIMAHVQEAAEAERTRGEWLFGLRKIWAGPLLVLFLGLLLGGYGLVQVLRMRGASQPVPTEPPVQSSKQSTGGEAGAKDAPALRSRSEAAPRSADDAQSAAPAPAEPSALPSPVQPGAASAPPTPSGRTADQLEGDTFEGKKESLFGSPPPAQDRPSDDKGAFKPLANRLEERSAPESAASAEGPRAPSGSSSRSKIQALEQPAADEPQEPVVCTLSPLVGSGPFISVQMPPSVAPPSGGVWTVVISADTTVRIYDSSGRPIEASLATLLDVIHPLHVPPGSYRLKRIT